MDKIKFSTKIYDLQTSEYVITGVELEVFSEELDVLRKVFARASKAHRVGITKNYEICEDMETNLAHKDEVAFSHDLGLFEDCDTDNVKSCGCKGL